MRLVIAEKPSLGQAIAEAIGGVQEKKGTHIIAGDTTIIWAFGHLLQLKEPEDYDPKYQEWKLEDLPISLPVWEKKPKISKVRKNETADEKYKREAFDKSSNAQLNLIISLLKTADVVINAGDPDDEGQLLIDEIIEFAKYNKEVKRILINDNSIQAIKKSLDNLEPNDKYLSLGISANARGIADMLLGINCTRFFSKKNDCFLSVGRVQTPTLGLIVNRDLKIKNHVKEYLYELNTKYIIHKASNSLEKDKLHSLIYLHKNEFINNEKKSKLLKEILEKFKSLEETSILNFKHFSKNGKVEKEDLEILKNYLEEFKRVDVNIEKKIEKEAPPLPFNLLKLQVYANKKWGYSTKKVLDITQELRDKYKAITYNRTDCQYLTEEHLKMSPELLKQTFKNLNITNIPDTSKVFIPKCFDNSKVTAHHGIIPTLVELNINKLTEEEKNIYTTISNFYIIQFLPPILKEKTEAVIEITEDNILKASSLKIIDSGYLLFLNEKDTEKEDNILSYFYEGKYTAEFNSVSIDTVETKPPKKYTEGSLLQDMSSISKYATNPVIKNILKEKDKDKKGESGGIGTPATRSNIIETLFRLKYIEMENKNIVSTKLGQDFFKMLPVELQTADLTAKWWLIQEEIKNGESEPIKLIVDVLETVTTIISRDYKKIDYKPNSEAKIGQCPKCGKNIYENKKTFYCDGYKTESKCNFIIWKENLVTKTTLKETQAKNLLENKKISIAGEKYFLDKLKNYKLSKEKEKKEEVICPECSEILNNTLNTLSCKCGFVFWKKNKLYGEFSLEEIKILLKGKTIDRHNLKSAKDKNYNAQIKIGKKGNIEFVKFIK